MDQWRRGACFHHISSIFFSGNWDILSRLDASVHYTRPWLVLSVHPIFLSGHRNTSQSAKSAPYLDQCTWSIRAWTVRSELHFCPCLAEIAMYLSSVPLKKSEFRSSFPCRELDEDRSLEKKSIFSSTLSNPSIDFAHCVVRLIAKKNAKYELNLFSIKSSCGFRLLLEIIVPSFRIWEDVNFCLVHLEHFSVERTNRLTKPLFSQDLRRSVNLQEVSLRFQTEEHSC